MCGKRPLPGGGTEKKAFILPRVSLRASNVSKTESRCCGKMEFEQHPSHRSSIGSTLLNKCEEARWPALVVFTAVVLLA